MEKWNTGRPDSIMLVGMHVGYLIGCWFNNVVLEQPSDSVPSHGPHSQALSTLLLYPVLKLAVGLPIVFVVRLAIRFVVLSSVCFAFGVDKKDPQTVKIPNVELLHKYFSYLLLGFSGVVLIPLVFVRLNIAVIWRTSLDRVALLETDVLNKKKRD